MTIKGANGEEHNVTSQGQGNYNTVGASAGIASFLGLNAGNVLGGGNRNGGGNGGNSGDDAPITRYEMNLMLKLQEKDTRIALLESNIYTDQKLADVYERLNVKINANKDAQDAINREQAQLNGATTAAVGAIKGQIAQLLSLTDLVIPSSKVCDTGCGCNQ